VEVVASNIGNLQLVVVVILLLLLLLLAGFAGVATGDSRHQEQGHLLCCPGIKAAARGECAGLCSWGWRSSSSSSSSWCRRHGGHQPW
jgi:hypothetical protein